MNVSSSIGMSLLSVLFVLVGFFAMLAPPDDPNVLGLHRPPPCDCIEPTRILLEISDDGVFRLNGQVIAEKRLVNRIRLGGPRYDSVTIEPHAATTVQQFVTALAAVREAGRYPRIAVAEIRGAYSEYRPRT